MKYITLNGDENQKMPIVGLGTWQATPQEVEEAILKALDLGYRHIDTAFNYNNEEAIGNALKRWMEAGKGTRDDLFVTSKLPHVGNRAKDVERFLSMSLKRLQLDYLNLYLIHMPFGFICDEKTLTPVVNNGIFQIDQNTNHASTWEAMEQQVRAGRVRNIGLSNFNERQIVNICKQAKIKPAVLQVELHAYLQQKHLRKTCKELGIAVTAYSPLGSPGAKSHFKSKYNYIPDDFPDILGHPIIKVLTKKYKKTPAQLLLHFLTQQDIIVIPKSSNPTRIQENLNIFDFDLEAEDMEKLQNLDRGEQGRIFNFFFFKGVESHPEYPFEKQLDN